LSTTTLGSVNNNPINAAPRMRRMIWDFFIRENSLQDYS